MRSKTLTRSSTITDAKIAVATLALLGALEVSLIAAPVAPQKKIVQQAPACTAQMTASARGCRMRGGVVGYREYRYTCPSGKKYKINLGCLTKENAQKRLDAACGKVKQCRAPAGAIAAPTPAFPDMAFVGGATFYRDIEGRYKVKFRYTNRGSVDVPREGEQQYNYRLLVTLLDANEQPLGGENVQTEGLAPLMAGQMYDMAWPFRSEDAAFLKLELQMGESMNDNSIDQDMSNNVIIVPVPPRPFPAGSDPRPEHSSDVIVSTIRVASSTLFVTVTNSGDAQFAALEAGIEVEIKGPNHQFISHQVLALPALAPQESTQLSLPLPQNAILDLVSLVLDPQNQGNESRLIYPNPIVENNRYSGPVMTSPSVSWTADAPSGVAAPSPTQVVGKIVISNPAEEQGPLRVHAFNLQIHSDIQVQEGDSRILRVYKDNLNTEPLHSTEWFTQRGGYEFRSENGPYFEIEPGMSKTIFITLDTTVARPENSLSIRLAPLEGMYWSRGESWHTTHLNSPPLVFKTFTY